MTVKKKQNFCQYSIALALIEIAELCFCVSDNADCLLLIEVNLIVIRQ